MLFCLLRPRGGRCIIGDDNAFLVLIHYGATAGNISLDSKSAFELSRFVVMVMFIGHILSVCFYFDVVVDI